MDTSHIHKTVLQLLCEAGFVVKSYQSNLHLFDDIGMDSLSFITLLTRIEAVFGIVFDINQMEDCLELNFLLPLIAHKLEGNIID